PRIADVDLARICLGIVKQFLEGARWRLGAGGKQRRAFCDNCDWYEILLGIVRQILLDHLVGRNRRTAANEDRVAVWGRTRELATGKGAGRSRNVLHRELLVVLRRQKVGHQASDNIAASARRV